MTRKPLKRIDDFYLFEEKWKGKKTFVWRKNGEIVSWSRNPKGGVEGYIFNFSRTRSAKTAKERTFINEKYVWPNTGFIKRTKLVLRGNALPSQPDTQKKQFAYRAVFSDGTQVHGTSLELSSYPSSAINMAKDDAFNNLLKNISNEYSEFYSPEEGRRILREKHNVLLYEGWIGYDNRRQRGKTIQTGSAT